jgi:DNA-binding PadR family transcriptional regulator
MQMTIKRAKSTELEGAILGVVRAEPNCTAYRVRQIFLASASAEWSGSAGAVYPAIKRLQAQGLISPKPESDGRGTRAFSLTRAGIAAHERWLCDIERAIGAGLDPFRTRAGSWPLLEPGKRRALMHDLKRQIEKGRNQLLRELPSLDESDATMLNLHVALQDLRLRWIELQLKKIAPASR